LYLFLLFEKFCFMISVRRVDWYRFTCFAENFRTVGKGEKLVACEPKQKPTAQVELKVNGKEIELNSFAQNFISQTVTGMAKSLRGVGDGETISLSVRVSGETK